MVLNPQCQFCKWYEGGNSCDAPQNQTDTSMALVDGSSRHSHRWLTCSYMRGFGFIGAFLFRACGRHGRWFVPMPTRHL